MGKSHLTRLLHSFSEKEMRLLEKHLHSPAFNAREEVCLLFDVLRRNLKSNDFSEQTDLFKQVFPKGDTDIQTFYLFKTYLLQAVESWLVLQEMKEEPTLQARLLARAYRHRHIDEPASRVLRDARADIEKQPFRDRSFFEKDHALRVEALHLSEQQGRAKSFDLQEFTDSLDIAFVCEKLQHACLLLSHQAVSQKAYKTGLLDPILSWLGNEHPYLEIPAVAAYYHGYFALKNENGDHHFELLKKILFEKADVFATEELRKIFLIAINFCIRRLNAGQDAYIREVFEIYKIGLEKEVFLENEVLSRFTYNNISAIGLKLKEHEWVRFFLEKYRFALPENHREAAFHFSMARYYYETGNHNAALEHLQLREYDDALHNLTSKTLLAKIYYETKEFEALDSLLDSLSAFARRNKGLGYHRDNTLAFVRFIRKSIALQPKDAAKKEALVKAIQGAKGFTEKGWLLEVLGV
jgi:hypothetical protein